LGVTRSVINLLKCCTSYRSYSCNSGWFVM